MSGHKQQMSHTGAQLFVLEQSDSKDCVLNHSALSPSTRERTPSLYADDVLLCLETPKGSLEKLSKLIAGCEI